jgi:AmmeMemoRadiSam system protein A
MPFDQETLEELRHQAGFQGAPAAHLPEHSLEMEVIFLRHLLPEARLIPLVVGQLGEEAGLHSIAGVLRSRLKKGDVVVVSSDFTHYGRRFGYLPFEDEIPRHLQEYLGAASVPLEAGDLAGFESHLEKTRDTICGREPIRILLAMLGGRVPGEIVASETSGNLTGDYANSVSYLSAVFRHADGWQAAQPEETERKEGKQVLDSKQQELALEMARRSLEAWLDHKKTLGAEDLGVPLTGIFRDPGAVFVTLERPGGQLRGCIGSILAHRPLWEDIRDNAINAGVRDPRFSPVTLDEVEALHLSVTVLSKPEPTASYRDFEVGRHGVILKLGGRRAVFLPQVAPEQGWDRETTLEHLSLKAGLSADAWRSSEARFELFEAQVIGKNNF